MKISLVLLLACFLACIGLDSLDVEESAALTAFLVIFAMSTGVGTTAVSMVAFCKAYDKGN